MRSPPTVVILLATGTVLHRGKRMAIATAEVMNGDVRVAILTGTTALTPPASSVVGRKSRSLEGTGGGAGTPRWLLEEHGQLLDAALCLDAERVIAFFEHAHHARVAK
jgi:hypothetical protein